MTASDQVTVLSADQTPIGETVSVADMIEDGAKIIGDGSVIATFHHVDSFPEFNPSVKEEQSGYYFPFQLSCKGKQMTLKKNGVTRADKTNMPFDDTIVFRVEEGDEFSVIVDGKPYINLNFDYSTFES